MYGFKNTKGEKMKMHGVKVAFKGFSLVGKVVKGVSELFFGKIHEDSVRPKTICEIDMLKSLELFYNAQYGIIIVPRYL